MTRALVVEDDPILRRITAMALRRQGWDVVEAASGVEALAAYDGAIDVALLDLMLPDMDGQAIFKALAALDADLSAVFLTARTDQDDALLALGAKGVLRKPFDPLKLADQVIAAAGL